MSTVRNGQQPGDRKTTRRLRFDDLDSIIARNSGDSGLAETAAVSETASPGHSGRRLVVVAGVLLLMLSGVLYLVFYDWRVRYRERALFGANQVVPAIGPMENVVPAGIDPGRWRDAVSQTRAMLLTVTGSNLLTVKEMNALRAELETIVARTGPGTAVRELACVWDIMGDRAEFLFKDSRSPDGDRHHRPTILPSYGATQVIPVIVPLESIVPPGVDPDAWRDAVIQTREMLLAVTDSKQLTIKKMNSLRAELEQVVARALAHPESAVDELAVIWNKKADRVCTRSRTAGLPAKAVANDQGFSAP